MERGVDFAPSTPETKGVASPGITAEAPEPDAVAVLLEPGALVLGLVALRRHVGIRFHPSHVLRLFVQYNM